MAYPNGSASTDLSLSALNLSDFSPEVVSAGIIDNVTPLNNTGFKHSLGYQISLVQNFVNNEFLGRPNIPVTDAYITNISGVNATINTQIYMSGGGTDDTVKIHNVSGVITSSLTSTSTLNETNITFDGSTDVNFTSTHNLILEVTGGGNYLKINTLPTSDPTVAGAVWNDSGTLKISL